MEKLNGIDRPPPPPADTQFPQEPTGWKWSFIKSRLFRWLFGRELEMIAAAGARSWHHELLTRAVARKVVDSALSKNKTLSEYNRKRFSKTYGK